jgi:hypothetical protein
MPETNSSSESMLVAVVTGVVGESTAIRLFDCSDVWVTSVAFLFLVVDDVVGTGGEALA